MWPYLCFSRSSEMRLVFLRCPFSCESPTHQTPDFSTHAEQLLDPCSTLCPVLHGVGKGCFSPKAGWPGCDVAEQQSISPTAPLPLLHRVLGACGGS